jgi:multidrug efflux pump
MEVAPQYRQEPGVLNTLYVGTGAGAVSGTAGTAGVASSTSTAAATGEQTASASSSASGAAGEDVVRNERANQLGNTGRGGISTGSAVSTSRQTMIPLSAFSHYGIGTTPVSVSHQGLFAASTISFNLAPGKSLGDASAEIERAANEIHMPESVHGGFAGTAALFQQALSNQPLLIGAALLTIYIVLGILYESTIHPITILSTLPPAGIGAVLALLLFNTEFTLIALIGVFLLIGIVKKNAIMMIDFALAAEREQRLTPHDAILQACLLRFRPILMTTFAALFGALPLAVGTGEGAELRQPLGIAIIGGLIVSQLLTLYTTPVIYLYLDRLRGRVLAWRARRHGGVLSEHRA